MEGQATDIEIEAREMLRIRDRLYTIYSNATGQPTDKIMADLAMERKTRHDIGLFRVDRFNEA